ncbi:hypothetical protein CUMW_136020 [Citrus unshiu]|nr:hypothetical protein CUMW_136020 [Citrus unshiu]
MGVRIYQSTFKHKAGGNNKIGKNLQWTMGQGLETWRRGDDPSRRREKEKEKEKEKNAATAADTMASHKELGPSSKSITRTGIGVKVEGFFGHPPRMSSSINTGMLEEVEPMLKFLDSWKNLLPSSVLDTILDTVVMPKVSSLVNSWNSSSETDPIHVLVQSWMQILGQKREGSYQMILIKLGEELEINPANQKLDQFNWVTSWASDIPIHLMADLMLGFFFTKWLQELLPQEILANESIRARLAIGLDMIAEAADGAKLDPAGYLLKPSLLNQIKQFEAPQIAAA